MDTFKSEKYCKWKLLMINSFALLSICPTFKKKIRIAPSDEQSWHFSHDPQALLLSSGVLGQG